MRPMSLGRIAGIPIRANLSAFFLPGLLAFLLATQVLPTATPGQASAAYLIGGAIAGLGLLASLLGHEATHALVALRRGIRTRSITLWMFGGVAELEREPDDPRTELRVAAAGPLASFGLSALFALAAYGAGAVGIWPAVAQALGWLAGANLLLGVFNLLPGSPLDGGRVLRAIVWWRTGDRARATRAATGVGRVIGWALVGYGVLQFMVGNVFGLWTGLIGVFLVGAAGQERAGAALRQRVGGLRVADVMSRAPATGPDWLSVRAFLDRLVVDGPQSGYVLTGTDGQVTGVVTLAQLGAVPEGERMLTRVARIATPAAGLATARPDEALTDLLDRLARHRPQLVVPVLDAAGTVVGALTPADIARAAEFGPLVNRREPVPS